MSAGMQLQIQKRVTEVTEFTENIQSKIRINRRIGVFSVFSVTSVAKRFCFFHDY